MAFPPEALLPILAAPIPAGPKALLVLLLELGGQITASYADIDRALGGTGSARATGAKVKLLAKLGLVESKRSAAGHIQVLLHTQILRLIQEMRTSNGLTYPKSVGGPTQNLYLGMGGRGVVNSNVSVITNSPEADIDSEKQRIEENQGEGIRGNRAARTPRVGLDVRSGDRSQDGAPQSPEPGVPARGGINTKQPQGVDSERHDATKPHGDGPESDGASCPGRRGVPAEESGGAQRVPGDRLRDGPASEQAQPDPERGRTGQLEIVDTPPKPDRKPRIPRDWSCSPTELDAMKRVQRALYDARAAAGMPNGTKPHAVNRTHVGPHRGNPGLLGRWRELSNNGENDPTGLLCGVIAAKVRDQGKSDSEKHRQGVYATGKTISVEKWWPGNLAAGRAELQPSAPRLQAPEDRGPEMKSLPDDVAGAIAASERVQAQLKVAAREHRRGRT